MTKINNFAKAIFRKFSRNVFWIILFFALFLILFLTPPAGDDLAFMNYQQSFPGLSGFLESFTGMFYNLNGRIVGNNIMFLVANHEAINSLFQALVIFSIIWSVHKIIAIFRADSDKNPTKFSRSFAPIITLFLLALPLAIYRQTYGWSSGFYNYVLPVALIFLAMVSLSQIFSAGEKSKNSQKELRQKSAKTIASFAEKSEKFEKSTKKIPLSSRIFFRAKIFLIALFSFLASLCTENITLGILFLSLIIFAISFRFKNKNFRFATFALIFGAILGTILMFSSPIYGQIAAGKDSYRSIESHVNAEKSKCYKIFGARIAKYCAKFSANVESFSNFLLNEKYYLLYAGAIFSVIFLFKKKYFGLKHRRLKFLKNPIVAKIFLALIILILIFLAFRENLSGTSLNSQKFLTIFKIINFFSAIGFYILLALFFFIYNENRKIAFLSSFCIFGSVIFVAPLLLVSPFGWRNFYVSFAFFALGILLILSQILNAEKIKTLREISLVGLWGIFAIYLVANSANFAVFLSNDSKAKSAIKNGEKVVEFREYIFKNFRNFDNSSSFSRMVTKNYYSQKNCVIYAMKKTCHSGNNLEIKFQK